MTTRAKNSSQLGLFAPRTRWEIPPGEMSWVEEGVSVKIYILAYCFDTAWPWGTPGVTR